MKFAKAMRATLVLAFVSLLLVVAATAQQKQSSNVEKKIDALLAQMTLEEKLGQLQQA